MAHCVSNMIGIRTGGVFSEDTDMDDLKKRVAEIILSIRKSGHSIDLGDENGDPSRCMSGELTAHKGSYVVIAGVFNYWTFEDASVFASQLSVEFGTEVMLMTWDELRDEVQCQIFLDGEPLFTREESPIGRILRRIQ